MATSRQILTDDQGAEKKKASLWASYKEMWKSNFAQRQSFNSALAAIVREGIKDVRSTFMESYFGKPEHPGEPGTPFNPTQQIVTAEMGNFHGYSAALNEAASRGGNASDRDQDLSM